MYDFKYYSHKKQKTLTNIIPFPEKVPEAKWRHKSPLSNANLPKTFFSRNLVLLKEIAQTLFWGLILLFNSIWFPDYSFKGGPFLAFKGIQLRWHTFWTLILNKGVPRAHSTNRKLTNIIWDTFLNEWFIKAANASSKQRRLRWHTCGNDEPYLSFTLFPHCMYFTGYSYLMIRKMNLIMYQYR